MSINWSAFNANGGYNGFEPPSFYEENEYEQINNNNMIVRIPKATKLKEMEEDLINLGYKKDKVRSMTSQASYIYLHEKTFERVNKFRYSDLIESGVIDCREDSDLFYAKAYDLTTY